jgi:hypothetical protein
MCPVLIGRDTPPSEEAARLPNEQSTNLAMRRSAARGHEPASNLDRRIHLPIGPDKKMG